MLQKGTTVKILSTDETVTLSQDIYPITVTGDGKPLKTIVCYRINNELISIKDLDIIPQYDTLTE